MFSPRPDNMKTPCVSLLLGVSVLLLLLSGLTVSAVSLNVSPNLQQFFREESVSLSCVGQTVDGWTVKRTRGGQTEQCGAAGSSFGNLNGSSCIISSLSPSDSAVYWCETSSGQKSDQVNITVTDITDGDQVILEIPALPVMIGSDVTLRCKRKDTNRFPVVFFRNGVNIGSKSEGEFTLSNVQQSDEGLYHCYTDEPKPSPQSRLRVRDPHTTTSSTTSAPPHTNTLYTATASSSPPPLSSAFIVYITAVLGSLVLLVLVVVGLVQLWRKHTGPGPGLRRLPAGWRSLSLLCCLTVLPAAGVAVLLYGLTVPSGSQDVQLLVREAPCVSVIRLFLHLVVFCPFFISTGLMVSICCGSRKTGNKPVVSVEMSQRVAGAHGLDKDDDVTTEYNS